MIRSFFRRGLRLGAVFGALLFLVRVILRRPTSPQPADSDAAPAPVPARPEAHPTDATGNSSTAATAARPGAGAASATAAPETGSEPATAAETAPKAKAAKPAAKAAKPAAAKAKKATKTAKASKAAKKKAAAPTNLPAWVEPVEGAAPATHPVKAKVASKIYHLPGMTAYDRTTPDRCYRDPEAAEADGFRKAQR